MKSTCLSASDLLLTKVCRLSALANQIGPKPLYRLLYLDYYPIYLNNLTKISSGSWLDLRRWGSNGPISYSLNVNL
jgi:hypothetical protein